MRITACLDSPRQGEVVQRHGFQLQGWAHADGLTEQRRIVAYVDDTIVGATQLRFARADVAQRYKRPEMADCGFTIACTLPERFRDRSVLVIQVAMLDEAGRRYDFATRRFTLSKHDYREHGHGDALRDGKNAVKQRSEIYISGPPSPRADSRAVNLIRRYVSPRDRLIDIGCGIGAYGHELIAHGYNWTGCDAREEFCDIVRTAGLPVVHVNGARLPFDDGAYEAALCIEVLEHIEDYARFVAEIRRVVTGRALFSVPNFEAIPIMSSVYTVPWHMLEGDHKNFFTRWSLLATLRAAFARVEVFEYGPLDRVVTQDGLPIYNHLFAVADVIDIGVDAAALASRNGSATTSKV